MSRSASLSYLKQLFLKGVRPFMAMLFVAIFSPQSQAQMACKDLFAPRKPLQTDTNESFLKKNNTSQSLIDSAVMGPLGQIFEIQKDGTIQQSPLYSEIKNRTTKLYNEKLKRTSAEKHSQMVEATVNAQKLTDDTVLLQIPSVLSGKESPLERAIRNRYQLMYIQMVNWVYRLSGLESNSALSNMKMMDEVSVYGNNMQFFDYALTFDHKVWDAQKLILTEKIDRYHAAADPQSKNAILNEIAQPTEAFLPMAGMVLAKPFLTGTKAVELKRYFKNDLEDPFHILGVQTKKNDFVVRHQMIYDVVKSLPPGTSLEIHAHTKVHIIAYLKLGFTKGETIANEKFPDATVTLLKAQREDVLEKIKTILNTNQ